MTVASSVFIWPGNITFTGTISFTGRILAADGTAVAPSYSFTAGASLDGLFRDPGGYPAIAVSGQEDFKVEGANGTVIRSDSAYGWANSTNLSGSTNDLFLTRDASNTLAQKNGINPQVSRLYGYVSGSRFTRGSLHTVTEAVTLSGATSATGNLIPVGCFVLGVATSTTTT